MKTVFPISESKAFYEKMRLTGLGETKNKNIESNASEKLHTSKYLY